MALEDWKYVEGFEGLYLISTWCRVMCLNYGNRGQIRILKQSAKEGYYPKVTLRDKEGKSKTFRTHQLVARAFLPPPKDGETQVDHIDGDKHNGKLDNLRYASPKTNSNNPATKDNYHKRYHREGEFERRSEGQRKRFERERETKMCKYGNLGDGDGAGPNPCTL